MRVAVVMIDLIINLYTCFARSADCKINNTKDHDSLSSAGQQGTIAADNPEDICALLD
jgi:hypothetical protein